MYRRVMHEVYQDRARGQEPFFNVKHAAKWGFPSGSDHK